MRFKFSKPKFGTIQYIIAIYLALSPLYFLLKLYLPTTLGSTWRDLLVMLIVYFGLLNIFIRMPTFSKKKNWSDYLVIFFLIFVLLQILNSQSLLTGIFGFRALFRCLPVFFVALLLLQGKQREGTMRLFFNAFLLGALINVFACALQFLTISILQIAPIGSLFDPIRGSTGFAATRFGMYRAVGFFSDPNDVGQIMVCALAIMLPRTMQGSKWRQRQLWKILCSITIFSIVGTLAIFAILPALLVILTFFSLRTNNRTIRKCLAGMSIGCLLIISSGMLRPDTPLTWLGYGYTFEQVINSFSYIPQAFEEGNIFGRGYGVSSELAERFGIFQGSIADRQTYWFYLDQITVQIGLMGTILWLCLWAVFLCKAYLNIYTINQKGSVEYRLALSTFLCLLGLFLSSLHYGPWRAGGVDLLLYISWAFVSTSLPARKIVPIPRRRQTSESICYYPNL